ncbi:MAG: hypothetical protein ABSE93_01075 [Terriglobia bacterium]
MAERPPLKLMISDLAQLLDWFEKNLCDPCLKDPRGHQVVFDCSRFAYMIKLVSLRGGKVTKPSRVADKIRCGKMSNSDFGGFSAERAQTLSWIPSIILRPTIIARNKSLLVPGDELYAKEFDKEGYRYKVLYCKRMSPNLLVPISSFPREKLGGLRADILWP